MDEIVVGLLQFSCLCRCGALRATCRYQIMSSALVIHEQGLIMSNDSCFVHNIEAERTVE